MGYFAGVDSIIKFKIIEDDEICEYKLVENSNGTDEVSINSPLGKKLNLSYVGEILKVKTEEPYTIKILEIKNPKFKDAYKEVLNSTNNINKNYSSVDKNLLDEDFI